MEITETQILEKWKEWGVEDKLPIKLKEPLKKHHLSVLKNTNARLILKIDAPSVNGPHPLILKINKGTPFDTKQKEWLLYKNLKDTELQEFLPVIYNFQKDNEDESWLVMEYLNPFTEEKELTVDQLFSIVERIAQLHAATYEHQPVAAVISGTLSGFQSQERTQHLDQMKVHLQQAKEDPYLKQVINEYCPELYELAELDLAFPELMVSGKCLIHGDLHIGNICYDAEQTIKFIDFSGATYSPCWLDLVKLIEFMMDHHPEWGDQEQIRSKALRIYLQTMKRGGVRFKEKENCYRFYCLAYLTTVFEKELRRHLKSILEGETRYIFPKILKKISRFSQELQLLH